MKKPLYFIMDYYDRAVIRRIIDKYHLNPMEATREFICSQTHALLEDADTGVWHFPEYAIFDMWETERITGDPRNSAYVGGV